MNSCLKPSRSPDSRPLPPLLDCLLFDLDDTLYSTGSGIADSLRKNIQDFLVERCRIATEKASSLRAELFMTHGSSLVGLRALGYDINADNYHGFVHERLPFHLIKPDHHLRNLLHPISQRKIIFYELGQGSHDKGPETARNRGLLQPDSLLRDDEPEPVEALYARRVPSVTQAIARGNEDHD